MKTNRQLRSFKGSQLSRKESQYIIGGRVRVQCTLSNGGSHIVEADTMEGIFSGIDHYNSYAAYARLPRIVGCAV